MKEFCKGKTAVHALTPRHILGYTVNTWRGSFEPSVNAYLIRWRGSFEPKNQGIL